MIYEIEINQATPEEKQRAQHLVRQRWNKVGTEETAEHFGLFPADVFAIMNGKCFADVLIAQVLRKAQA